MVRREKSITYVITKMEIKLIIVMIFFYFFFFNTEFLKKLESRSVVGAGQMDTVVT